MTYNETFCDRRRVRVLRDLQVANSNVQGPILYWMQRDQRAIDNWAIVYAQELALKYDTELIVVFNVVPSFLGATLRQYDFMLKGLFETKSVLDDFNIPLIFTFGEPEEEFKRIIDQTKSSIIVTDFNPLRIVREWKKKIVRNLEIEIHEVDSHNIVPAFFVSQKQEYGAYTLRPKIKKHLKDFLGDFPRLKKMPYSNMIYSNLSYFTDNQDFGCILEQLNVDKEIQLVDWLKPGQEYGMTVLEDFLRNKLKWYSKLRNDPTQDATSNLSPYLHFGQLSTQRVALEVLKYEHDYPESVSAFLEELIIRRELADNFCLYNEKYDSFEGFPEWARKTLNNHRTDKRLYVYSLEEFEYAKTHDDLWNAAQKEMVRKGKMHGYLRMYWAKKILEWTASPEEALKYAIYLNDKYELDGRDPNGYTGIAWAIGGVHDRPWSERSIFGMVRYMSYDGCKKKFDVKRYIENLI